jgi:polysaccharide export outer membrane protein
MRLSQGQINSYMKQILGLLLIFLCSMTTLLAQVTPEDLQKQLEEMGLEEEEVMQKLAEKGIDINNIDPSNVGEVEKALEEVIAELQAEKAAQNGQAPPPAPNLEEVKEELQDNAESPPPGNNADTEAAGEAKPKGESTEQDQANPQPETPTKAIKNDIPPPEIYGHQFYRDLEGSVNLDAKNIKAPDSYVIGPGDEMAISIFGISQASFSFEVNIDGYISPPNMGRIYLKGITMGDAKRLLRSRFAQYYAFGPGEFNASLSYSRVINVNIVGEVFQPGGVSIPATNTLFNALVAIGGPSNIGSVRKIRLMRNGEAPKTFDTYEYLKDPSVEMDFYLQENDYIHVPILEKVVEITGGVKRPYKYELIEGENLKKLIEYAGGFQSDAYQGNVQITRIQNDKEVILDVNYRDLVASGGDFQLFGGDIVAIASISKPYENFVEISGAIEFEGRYQLNDNMRVSDLLQQGKLLNESRTDIAYLFRTKPDESIRLVRVDLNAAQTNPGSAADIVLEPKDKLQIFSQIPFVDKASVSSSGAVREPITVPYDPVNQIKVSDLLMLSNGIQQNAAEYAYIKRTDPTNKTNIDYVRVNVFNVIADTSSADNRTLKPNDQLIIYTKEQFLDASNIVVTGAVRNPGEFDFDDGLRVSDVVYFSDGLKPDATDFAYINRLNRETQEIEYIRVNLKNAMENTASPDNLVLKPFDKLTVLSKTTFLDETTVSVTGSVREVGTYPFHESLTLRDALTLAGGLKFGAASNRVEVSRVMIRNNQPTQTVVAIVEVDDDLNPISGQGGNFQLQPYDQVIVRNVPDFKLQENIIIEGEVKYPGTHPLLSENERLSSLINRAGGLTEEAFPEGATLLRAEDGVGYIIMDMKEALKKENSKFNFILKSGDIISVPTKKDFVSITGATKAQELYLDEVLKDGKITVPHHLNKRAGFYVRKYAAGVGEDGKASQISVLHPNGEVKKTQNFGLFLIHPKVRKGSEVVVGIKPKVKKEQEDPQEKSDIDWGEVVADSIAQATAILSLILLIQNVNR